MNGSDRGSARDGAIVRTLLAGAGLQLTIGLSTLIALPFVTRELTAPEFGVFATLSGFALLLAFADFGIGGALTTDLARAIGRDNLVDGRRLVSTAAAAATAIGVLTFVVLAVSVELVPWQRLLGAQQVAATDLREALFVVASVTALSVPASLGQRLLYGIQKGATANTILVIAACIGAVMLTAAAAWDWPLSAFVAVSLGTPVLAGLACGGLALRVWPTLRPSLRLASLSEWRRLRASSGWHFAIGVAGAVSFQTDALVVSSVLGAATAGVFAVAVRLFGLVAQSLYPAMLQLWPTMSEAYERGEFAWIRSRLTRVTLVAGAASLIAGVVLTIVGPRLIGLLLTDSLIPGRDLMIALTCWTTYSLVSAPSFLLLNATGHVRVHAITAIVAAVVNLPLTIVLAHAFGVAGPVWASLGASAAVSALPWLIVVRRVLAGDAQSSEAR